MILSRKPTGSGILSPGLTMGVTALLLLLSSCRQETIEGPAEKDSIRKEFERGPVKVILETDRKELSIADRLNFRIEIIADEAYDVQLPRFGDKLEQFAIVDYRTGQPELVEGGKVRQSRFYVLEPFLSGEYSIPPMTVEFRKKGDTEPKRYEIETEGIGIKVGSLLGDDAAALDIHEIGPPVDLPRLPAGAGWIGAGACAVVAVSIAGLLWLRSRRRRRWACPDPVPAHEIAFDELRGLVDEGLIEKGRIKLFYQRISDIVRRYIERRFGLHAPEQTTEEFLECIKSGTELSEDHKSLLSEFLSNCDLVKFAEHVPDKEDIQKTFDSCKSFISGSVQETGTGTAESGIREG